MIYATTIEVDSKGKYLLEQVGHGHHSGAGGDLYSDMQGITTAKDIVSFIVVELAERQAKF